MNGMLILGELLFHADDDMTDLLDFGPKQMDEFGLLLDQGVGGDWEAEVGVVLGWLWFHV